MKIGILGTRGIPNNYGGFEQFAEYLSKGLVERGVDVSVYNSHDHPYQSKEWNGVKIIHCFDPEKKLGTAGQFIYDLNCIRDCRKRSFDIILQLGYTSSSVWGALLPRKRTIVTTNMDGLEWKRSKYSPPVRRFLKYAERLGVKYSDHHISDSVGIQQYLKENYNIESEFIPYGADVFVKPDKDTLGQYSVVPYSYNMLIARLEPENSIQTILDGVQSSKKPATFLVIGNHITPYGEFLKSRYRDCAQIRFLGGIYNFAHLNNLRYYANIYFHGHTVGGTNPSLLEAMASSSLVCAHDNIFNKSILGSDAYYFSTSSDVSELLQIASATFKAEGSNPSHVDNNLTKIQHTYSWDHIVQQYMDHFNRISKNIKPTK